MEQPQYNMFHRQKVEVDYDKIYKTVGLGTTIWSPLSSGILTDKYLSKFPKGTRLGMKGLEWLKDAQLSPERLRKVQKLNDLALNIGTTLPRMAVAWCAVNPNVSTVILGASKVNHLKETLKAIEDIPLLTPKVLDRVEKILNNKPVPPQW